MDPVRDPIVNTPTNNNPPTDALAHPISNGVEPESIPPPEAPEPEVSPLKQIRTFEGDVADAIKKKNESIYSIQQAEEKKRQALEHLAPGSTVKEVHHAGWKPLVMSLLTIIFLAGGGYGAYFAWVNYSNKVLTPPIETPRNQFVSAGSVTNIDASVMGRNALIDLVSGVRDTVREETAIEHIELNRASGTTTELLSTSDFLSRISAHAPPSLVRAFNDLFMLGVLGGNPGHTFFAIKLDSFENAFPGMLDWEGRMVEDILPFFVDQNILPTISSLSEFEDKTIQNQDTRVLRAPNGETVMIYGFLDNSLLIITDNETSYRTLVNRLESQKLSR